MEKTKPKKNSYTTDFNLMRDENCHHKLINNSIQPYFDNLEKHLVEYIEKSTYVIGCVAWLTNRNIIEALENICGAKIIINKEEFLSSKMVTGKKFYYKCLRGRYNDIPDMFASECLCCSKSIMNCDYFKKIFGTINNLDKNKDGSILTCGIVNNFSKMHHKFLIFFDSKMNPTGLWTGSYNLSSTSNFSLENALYITNKDIINEYIKEFIAIYSYSEPYNWESGVLYAPIGD